MIRRPQNSPRFPYTTLFRSSGGGLGYGGILNSVAVEFDIADSGANDPDANHVAVRRDGADHAASGTFLAPNATVGLTLARSEEHTSELQSHSDLVCRLLLEK